MRLWWARIEYFTAISGMLKYLVLGLILAGVLAESIFLLFK